MHKILILTFSKQRATPELPGEALLLWKGKPKLELNLAASKLCQHLYLIYAWMHNPVIIGD